ncbi:UDP-glucose 4-epimerase [Ectothiorhodosinus mongolicus]|nr:UDP-glucose 4-epimerase [Ectothiorhodosinus mongolicus]
MVTGASGFVGAALCRELDARGFAVRGAVRSLHSSFSLASGIEPVAVGNLDAATDWSSALAGVDCVIHCAARAHVMHETEADALAAYRSVNVDGSRHLAEQAAAAGVRRLVYLSSIGVLGIHTNGRGPFFVSDASNPVEDYAVSKWEAEQALWAVAANTGLEVVVVRPPLVYGPGAKGNLARLLKLVRSGVPLPLGAVHNQRSLIGLDNLVDLLIRCVDHPAAAGQTLLVSDGEDVSTPDLLRHMAAGLGRSARLVPVPVPLLRLAGRALGKQAEVDRLVGSLQIDSRHTRELLDWTPPVSLAEGIRRMVQGA